MRGEWSGERLSKGVPMEKAFLVIVLKSWSVGSFFSLSKRVVISITDGWCFDVLLMTELRLLITTYSGYACDRFSGASLSFV